MRNYHVIPETGEAKSCSTSQEKCPIVKNNPFDIVHHFSIDETKVKPRHLKKMVEDQVAKIYTNSEEINRLLEREFTKQLADAGFKGIKVTIKPGHILNTKTAKQYIKALIEINEKMKENDFQSYEDLLDEIVFMDFRDTDSPNAFGATNSTFKNHSKIFLSNRIPHMEETTPVNGREMPRREIKSHTAKEISPYVYVIAHELGHVADNAHYGKFSKYYNEWVFEKLRKRILNDNKLSHLHEIAETSTKFKAHLALRDNKRMLLLNIFHKKDNEISSYSTNKNKNGELSDLVAESFATIITDLFANSKNKVSNDTEKYAAIILKKLGNAVSYN